MRGNHPYCIIFFSLTGEIIRTDAASRVYASGIYGNNACLFTLMQHYNMLYYIIWVR